MVLELLTVVVFKAEPLHWILLHQPLTNGFALFAELGRVCNWIVQDPASHLGVLNLKGRGKRFMYILGHGREMSLQAQCPMRQLHKVPFLLAL